MTYGLSRDDSVKFLNDYIVRGIYKKDPFQELDADGVGGLMKIAIERGRKANKKIKLGICGEHGGDPASISSAIASGSTMYRARRSGSRSRAWPPRRPRSRAQNKREFKDV